MPRGRVFPPSPIVACCVCFHLHRAGSTGVLYRSADGRWWCRNELACRRQERQHVADVAAMWRALDQVWAGLEADGWRWPA